jgi:hypothetical protein
MNWKKGDVDAAACEKELQALGAESNDGVFQCWLGKPRAGHPDGAERGLCGPTMRRAMRLRNNFGWVWSKTTKDCPSEVCWLGKPSWANKGTSSVGERDYLGVV